MRAHATLLALSLAATLALASCLGWMHRGHYGDERPMQRRGESLQPFTPPRFCPDGSPAIPGQPCPPSY